MLNFCVDFSVLDCFREVTTKMSIQSSPTLGESSLFSLTNHEVYLVTSRVGDKQSGFIATWVLPASLLEGYPRLLIAVSVMNYSYELIEQSGRFVLHMLAEGQEKYLPDFGLFSGREKDKFTPWKQDFDFSGWAPALKQSCGQIKAKVVRKIELGERVIYIADVLDQITYQDRLPLRKREAFQKLPYDIQIKMKNKQRDDGVRALDLYKIYS